MIKRFFSPPVFDKEEDNFRAKFINGFAWTIIVLLVLSLIPTLGPNADPNADTTIIFLISIILISILSLYSLKKGYLTFSGSILVAFVWLGFALQAYAADGVRDIIVVAFIAISLLASIVINWRAGSMLMVLSIGMIWTLAILETNGFLTPRFQEPIAYSRDLSLVFVAIAVLIYFSTTILRDAITRATKSEQGLIASNKTLQDLNQTLEERVNQRTAELDNANRYNSRRARQFEAISQVVRAVSSIQDLDTLLPQITKVISEQFNIYHTGIFLLDENREFAVLRAANSEGGIKMLARKHKLEVGETGIVGFVAATGQPRIASDVGADAVFFNNPDLPNTHSEIALPLRYAGQTIGALDVQSLQPNAFTQDDIEILIILADQVSTAIKNTLAFEETRKTVSKFESSLNEKTSESWKVMRQKSLGMGFQLIGSTVRPLGNPLEGEHIQQVLTQNKAVLSNDGESDSSNLTIPIRLRGQTIGIINLRTNDNYKLTDDDTDIAMAVTERLSLAIESATLLQATQHRADIERLTTDISSKISSSTRFETILQTAAQELSKALGGSDVLVQIEPTASDLEIYEG
jgi:GAF domain-containing protein